MKSSWLVAVAFVLFAAVWIAGATIEPTTEKSPQRLPGVRATIDAADYPTLQAALDALPDEGGTVRLPPGRFEIDEPLILARGEVLVEGCGPATHIHNTNRSGQPALVIRHPDGPNVPRQKRLWRVQLCDLRITGNPQSGHGIEAHQIEELFLQRLTVTHHGGDGIHLDHCYEDPRIADSLITYNAGAGLLLQGCHDIVVSSNQFEENDTAVKCLDGFNLCMTGNCVDDHLSDGVVIENTYGSVVSGNMIEECRGAAIVLDRDCYGITLSANVIAHNGAGIDLRDAHGCAVSANTFTINKDDALRIGPGSGRIAATGNCFANSAIGDGKLRRGTDDMAAAGITLEGTRDSVLVGNCFSGVRPAAVVVKNPPSRRIVFVGNGLSEVTSEHDRLVDSVVDDNLLPENR